MSGDYSPVLGNLTISLACIVQLHPDLTLINRLPRLATEILFVAFNVTNISSIA
jgi:hypothetical protein